MGDGCSVVATLQAVVAISHRDVVPSVSPFISKEVLIFFLVGSFILGKSFLKGESKATKINIKCLFINPYMLFFTELSLSDSCLTGLPRLPTNISLAFSEHYLCI